VNFGDLLVKGAAFEVAFQVVHDDAVFDYLLQVAVGERLGVEVAKDEESEGEAFDVADGNGIGGCCVGREKDTARDKNK